MSHYCDFVRHCSDGSDELACIQPSCPKGQLTCRSGQCIDPKKKCDGIKDCWDGSDEHDCPDCTGFLCWSGVCIPPTSFRDLYADCGIHGEDEAEDKYDVIRGSEMKVTLGYRNAPRIIGNQSPYCSNSSDLGRCSEYHSKCFPRHAACVYDQDTIGRTRYCRNLVHIQSCEFFECPQMFKCPKAYCIPLHRVCNGVQDCPDGTDERHCTNYICPGHLQCRGNSKCIDRSSVCDGIVDCEESKDDELFCEDYKCPAGCLCKGTMIICEGKGKQVMPKLPISTTSLILKHNSIENISASFGDMPRLGKLDLSFNAITSVKSKLFATLSNLLELNLMNNTIFKLLSYSFIGLGRCRVLLLKKNPLNEIGQFAFEGLDQLEELDLANLKLNNLQTNTFAGLKRLTFLDLRHNLITHISQNAFGMLHKMQYLLLTGNPITHIKPLAFQGLPSVSSLDLSNMHIDTLHGDAFNGLDSLKSLDLNSNRITDVQLTAFQGLPSLQNLNIKYNQIVNIEKDAFKKTNIANLTTDAFKFCCLANSNTNCTPKADAFSSCDDLMANSFLQIAIWVQGGFAFTFNIYVFITRLKEAKEKVPYFFVANLGIADFLMSIYLLIIGTVDVYYRGNFIVFADEWKSSIMCKVAGFLSMTSCEMSVVMVLFISLDRLIVTTFSSKVYPLRMVHAMYMVAAGWAVCILLALLPLLPIGYFGGNFYGAIPVCLPFHSNQFNAPGWEFVMALLIFNLVAFCFIVFAYGMIFFQTRKVGKEVGRDQMTANDVRLARKVALLVGTDFACWVPIVLISFLSFFAIYVPPQVSAWIAVVVLPINSSLNPLLYSDAITTGLKLLTCALCIEKIKQPAVVVFSGQKKSSDFYGDKKCSGSRESIVKLKTTCSDGDTQSQGNTNTSI